MGGDDDRASVSAWVPQDTLDEFDRLFDCGPDGSESRSELLVRLMKDAIVIERELQTTNYEFDHPEHRRGWLRQAIWDHYRREQAQQNDA